MLGCVHPRATPQRQGGTHPSQGVVCAAAYRVQQRGAALEGGRVVARAQPRVLRGEGDVRQVAEKGNQPSAQGMVRVIAQRSWRLCMILQGLCVSRHPRVGSAFHFIRRKPCCTQRTILPASAPHGQRFLPSPRHDVRTWAPWRRAWMM
jgi:hypothetical protein